MGRIEWFRTCRKAGGMLGRAGLSERVIELVNEFNKDPSYKDAIILAGRMKAIGQACGFDGYWSEKLEHGYHAELARMESIVRERGS